MNKPLAIQAYESLTDKQRKDLSALKTIHGANLDKIIKSGTENPDSEIGCYAADADSYTKFAKIFDYVIQHYHKLDNHVKQKNDFNVDDLPEFLPSVRKKIKSVRIRVARCLDKFPFTSQMSKADRLNVEKEVLIAAENVFKDDEFKGKYFAISSIKDEIYNELLEKHLIFKKGDKYLQSAGILYYWPSGRGSYISNDEKFSLWINEEDHMRITYLQKSADIHKVSSKLFEAIKLLEKNLKFARNVKYGFLNSCPTNIGTGMRASIHIHLPEISYDCLKDICKQNGLSLRGTYGEHTQIQNSTYDISFKKRLGMSEREIIQTFVQKVNSVLSA